MIEQIKEQFKANPILRPAFLFLIAFLMSFSVLYYENVNRIDYWKNLDVSKTNDIVLQKCHYNAINSSSKILERAIVVKNSIQVLTLSNNNIECFKDWEYFNNSVKISWTKMFLLISEFLVLIAYFLSFFLLFSVGYRKLKLHLTHKKEEHIVIIGLSEISKTLVESLLKNQNQNKIVVLDKDKNNFYIDEVRKQGAIVIIGDASQELFLNDAKVYTAKEIYIMCKDIINLEITSTIFNKLNVKQDFKRKTPLDIYIHLKIRSNRELFDQNGLFKLKYDSLNFYPFSFDEIIAKRLFVKRPLTLTIKDPWDPNEMQRILIVDFNNMAEEILYQVLKIGHFVNAKPIEIVVIDDDYKALKVKYQNWINIGDNPYNTEDNIEDKKSIWKLSFIGTEKLYDGNKESSELFLDSIPYKFKFNRIVFCNEISGQSMEWLNFINKRFITDISDKKTIIQLYNANVNFGGLIDKNISSFNSFYTFGEITSLIDSSIIKESNLYRVARISNNYKELVLGKNISKVWENLDLFTRESNITEKEHMDIKLHALGLSCYDNFEESFIIPDSNKIRSNDYADLKNKIESLNNDSYSFKIKLDKNNPISLPKISILEFMIKVFKKLSEGKRNCDEVKEKIEILNNDLGLLKIKWDENNSIDSQKISILKLFILECRKILKDKENNSSEMDNKIKNLNNDINSFKIKLDKNNPIDSQEINILEPLIKEVIEILKDRKKNNIKTENEIYEIYDLLYNLPVINRTQTQNILHINMKSTFHKLPVEAKKNLNLDSLNKIIKKENTSLSDKEKDLRDLAYSFFEINDLHNLEKEQIEKLAQLEHTRWNAFHLLNGWRRKVDGVYRKNGKLKNTKDLKLKLHYDICDWETLKKDDDDAIKYDYKNIYHIPYIYQQLGKGIVTNQIIGITGNRELTTCDSKIIKEEIRDIFTKIIKSKKKITIFSPLADGADRLVVEVALDEFPNNMYIKVPIPFDLDIYKETFCDWDSLDKCGQQKIKKQSISDFECLINKITEKQYCNPIIEMKFDRENYDNCEAEEQQKIRRKQYSIVGEYVASNSDYLMAIYHDDKEGKAGGTKEILKKAQSNKYTHFNKSKKISTIYKMIIKNGKIIGEVENNLE